MVHFAYVDCSPATYVHIHEANPFFLSHFLPFLLSPRETRTAAAAYSSLFMEISRRKQQKKQACKQELGGRASPCGCDIHGQRGKELVPGIVPRGPRMSLGHRERHISALKGGPIAERMCVCRAAQERTKWKEIAYTHTLLSLCLSVCVSVGKSFIVTDPPLFFSLPRSDHRVVAAGALRGERGKRCNKI